MKTRIFAALLGALVMGPSAFAADHLDAPSLEGRGQVDVNDLYAFQSPTDPDKSVLIMTVNPFAGVASPTDFGTNVDYEFNVDNNGDAIADLTYRATFSGNGSEQVISLERDSVGVGTGGVGQQLDVAGGGTLLAGIFDDPFFFDLAGFNDGFQFTGVDTLAGANVSAIVLEVPSSDLGGPNVGIWARTVQDGNQVDRIGRPAINTALIPTEEKEAFNLGSPVDDPSVFGDSVRATITALSDASNADGLTPILVPDVLTFDTSNANGFLNGRKLADDVIDAELNLLSAGGVTGDGVDLNDVPFSAAFPYLGEAHVVPEPSSGLIALIGMLTLLGSVRRKRQRV